MNKDMQLDLLLKRIENFYKLASEGSDDINTILKKLSKLDTHKARFEYAEKHLDHLSSGSSRVIYTFNNKKEVLKLAKNDRGLAQNKAEAKIKSKFINKTTKSDPKGIWKISPYANKVSEKEFEKISKISFEDFGKALEYGLQAISSDKEKKPKNFEKVSKTDLYKEIVNVSKENKLLPGDLSRISSWGEIDNKLILLDAGLTREIYDSFYEKDSKSK
jgi:hypothetical protein